MRPVAALVALLACPLGCAHRSAVQKLDVDTYRVTCPELALDRCLNETASNVCDKRAYFVARGISEINLRGRSDAPDVATSSEAVIRCAPGSGWGDQAKVLMATDPGATLVKPAGSPPAKPPVVCAPGATQTCVGAGACQGGQACKADGSGYGACDCGTTAPAAPPTSAPAAPPTSAPAPAPAS